MNDQIEADRQARNQYAKLFKWSNFESEKNNSTIERMYGIHN